ncbi:MAG: efflux RND transporter periplasmic adaptor subunit [Betaproteobacteria bacterium]|nr:efflux RND transporter periplasmic adaptor subunit [Betaproteobacteria bacterium]MDE2621878.1 efflux RND transporter periplasmic adaptor subunit [Betaproteobacteria bacterium]
MSERQSNPSFKKRMTIMLVLVAILVGGLVAFQIFKSVMIRKFMAASGEPPQAVSTSTASRSAWVPEFEAVGSLRAVRGVDISPEVAGTVRQMSFHSGDRAKAGQVLLEMVDDAEKAQLNMLEASASLARITMDRDRAQYKAQAISKAQLDADTADLQSKEAQLSQQKALLAKKILVAPFEGRLGITTINPGQYLNPGDKVVTLQQIAPILVDFNVPQQRAGQLKVGGKVTVQTDAWPGKVFPGVISAISPLVDASTRNLSVEARLDNPQEILLPGMFGKVHWNHGEPQSLITVPQSAITYNPYGATLFILKPAPKRNGSEGKAGPKVDWVAEQVFVTTGPTRGDQVAVLSGIDAGATVVTSGQMKLKTGTPVIINNQLLPPNDPSPTPQEK